jgi:rhodanese-related sulfurtransferase
MSTAPVALNRHARNPTTRARVGLVALALILSLAAAGGAASPSSGHAAGSWVGALPEHDLVSALELAGLIREQPQRMQLVDLRSNDAFEEDHLPLAVNIEPAALRETVISSDSDIVLYAMTEKSAARGKAVLEALGREDVRVLDGGYVAWMLDVMLPVLPANASPEEAADFERISELSLYFGGDPQVGDVAAQAGDRLAFLKKRLSAARKSGCGW